MNKKYSLIFSLLTVLLLSACASEDLKITDNENSNSTNKVEVETPSESIVEENSSTNQELSKYSLADIAKHAVKEDCWLAIEGKVYDVTAYIDKHPGGDKLLKGCGIDATDYFNGNGKGRLHSAFARTVLSGFVIGSLDNQN